MLQVISPWVTPPSNPPSSLPFSFTHSLPPSCSLCLPLPPSIKISLALTVALLYLTSAFSLFNTVTTTFAPMAPRPSLRLFAACHRSRPSPSGACESQTVSSLLLVQRLSKSCQTMSTVRGTLHCQMPALGAGQHLQEVGNVPSRPYVYS